MYKHKSEIVIAVPKRSAIGKFGGGLGTLPASDIAAQVISAILSESKVPLTSIDQVLLGSVLQAGQGQAPARQAALKSGLPNTVQASTINKVCSSGLKAIMLAANDVELGACQAVIAGGMENMSLAPYYLPSLRNGARLGNAVAEDAIIKDGLWDVYNNQHMGNCAELCAREHKISREEQDQFALGSYEKALKSIANQTFKTEITPIKVQAGKNLNICETDEEPGQLKKEKVPELRPVFDKNGTVTAANASSLNDGAAAMIVCSSDYAKQHNLTPVARIVAQGWNAQAPEWFTTAPVGAIQNAVKAAGLDLKQIDLFEINEAFSVVAIAIQRSLEISQEKINIYGGAVALGHPIGASGARIVVTLINALHRTKGRYGVASLCNGGGEATALVIERI